ncbi:hypothetical protein V1517DRAFT_175131 [Lipomyces orientalis]|uniref:Uncharacterized protein n=1 Tax=Lipomyces orientalis TaxID=1233043 RepID=A0ACC3TK66_9ASCO
MAILSSRSILIRILHRALTASAHLSATATLSNNDHAGALIDGPSRDQLNLLELEMYLLMAEGVLLLTEGMGEDGLKEDAVSILDFRVILPTIISSLLANIESRRYLNRSRILRHSATTDLLLNYYKVERPDIFRNKLRVYPETFDGLVTLLKEAPVFLSMTGYNATSVEMHLAILLYRLGHYGNGASIEEVASWAGVGAGTVDCITKRTLFAIFQIDLESSAVRWPTPEEREQYKQWVEAMSCPEWRNG